MEFLKKIHFPELCPETTCEENGVSEEETTNEKKKDIDSAKKEQEIAATKTSQGKKKDIDSGKKEQEIAAAKTSQEKTEQEMRMEFFSDRQDIIDKLATSNLKKKIELTKLIRDSAFEHDLVFIKDNPNQHFNLNDMHRLFRPKWMRKHVVLFIFKKLSEELGVQNEKKTEKPKNLWVVHDNDHFGVIGFHKSEPIFMDSIPNSDYLSEKVRRFEKQFKKTVFRPPNFPVQQDTVNCGIFVLIQLFLYSQRHSYPQLFEKTKRVFLPEKLFAKEKIQSLRELLFQELLIKKGKAKFADIFKKFFEND